MEDRRDRRGYDLYHTIGVLICPLTEQAAFQWLALGVLAFSALIVVPAGARQAAQPPEKVEPGNLHNMGSTTTTTCTCP